jgi:hypothetical protein
MTVSEVQIRPLRTEDAERCDQIIASLPYHFGQEDAGASAPTPSAVSPAWWPCSTVRSWGSSPSSATST